jgi:hypothetical protein
MKELRCLVFTEAELIHAVVSRRRKIREPLPVGTVQKVTFEQGEELVTTLHMADDYGKDCSLRLGAVEVAAAMVNFCIERKIPLPVASNKHLQLLNNSLSLMITMHTNKT